MTQKNNQLDELKSQSAGNKYKELLLPSEYTKMRIKQYLISQNIEGSREAPAEPKQHFYKLNGFYYPLTEQEHI